MNYRIVRLPLAQADVEAIWLETASHNEAAADRVVTKVAGTGERLLHFPISGRDRSDLAKGLRSISCWPYIIFYQVIGDTIEIVRVLHGARDVAAAFERPRRL